MAGGRRWLPSRPRWPVTGCASIGSRWLEKSGRASRPAPPLTTPRDAFVAENYRDLRERRVFSAGVPAELGGGGASHADLCAMLRALAHYCGSTALALAMHTHQVAIPAWRWRHEPGPRRSPSCDAWPPRS